MTTDLIEKINKLPEKLKEQVDDFVDFLVAKHGLEEISSEHARLLDERYPNGFDDISQDEDWEVVRQRVINKYGIQD